MAGETCWQHARHSVAVWVRWYSWQARLLRQSSIPSTSPMAARWRTWPWRAPTRQCHPGRRGWWSRRNNVVVPTSGVAWEHVRVRSTDGATKASGVAGGDWCGGHQEQTWRGSWIGPVRPPRCSRRLWPSVAELVPGGCMAECLHL
jgi:hypothetical protein